MSRDELTDRDPQCISCDSESTERLEDRCRCLDCGAIYQVAPNGKPVYTVKGWWFVRIGLFTILLVALASTVVSVAVGWPVFSTIIYALIALAVIVLNNNEIQELIEYGV